MSTRRKHRALNGITQGDVNLGRAGGELNMIRGLQREGWRKGAGESEGRDAECGRRYQKEEGGPQKVRGQKPYYATEFLIIISSPLAP